MAIYDFSKASVGETETLKKLSRVTIVIMITKENNRNIHITVIIFKKLGRCVLVLAIIFFCSVMKCLFSQVLSDKPQIQKNHTTSMFFGIIF